MEVQSESALIASLVALVPTLLIGLLLIKEEPGWGWLFAGLLALPGVLALTAAFARHRPFRLACLTAAFIASVPPMLLLIASLYGAVFGTSLMPGVGALLIAAISAMAKCNGLVSAVATALLGIAAGAGLILAWWPIIEASGGNRDAGEGVALGLGIVLASLFLVGLTRLVFPEPTKPANSVVTRVTQ